MHLHRRTANVYVGTLDALVRLPSPTLCGLMRVGDFRGAQDVDGILAAIGFEKTLSTAIRLDGVSPDLFERVVAELGLPARHEGLEAALETSECGDLLILLRPKEEMSVDVPLHVACDVVVGSLTCPTCVSGAMKRYAPVTPSARKRAIMAPTVIPMRSLRLVSGPEGDRE